MAAARFIRELHHQLDFLKTSCCQYDTGNEREAVRIAAILRTLFHSTGKSTSLLKHLNMDNCPMLSRSAKGNYMDFVSLEFDPAKFTVRATPNVGMNFNEVPLPTWWEVQQVSEFGGKVYTRKEVIRTAADKDGGTHVDADLTPFYENLASGLGHFTVRQERPSTDGSPAKVIHSNTSAENVHLAMLRSFGHEVLSTAVHFKWRTELKPGT